MITVAEITGLAFDGVSGAMDGVIFSAILEHDVKSNYNVATGVYDTISSPQITGGRSVETTDQATLNRFPAYTIGPDDVILLLEGFTTLPKVGWRVITNSKTRTIKAVGDIVGAGEGFFVIVS